MKVSVLGNINRLSLSTEVKVSIGTHVITVMNQHLSFQINVSSFFIDGKKMAACEIFYKFSLFHLIQTEGVSKFVFFYIFFTSELRIG